MKVRTGATDTASLARQFDMEPDMVTYYVDRDQRVSTPDRVLADVTSVLTVAHWTEEYRRELPDPQSDRALLHFLHPDAHAGAGAHSAVYQQADAAIRNAQAMRLAGPGMLHLYADYSDFIRGHDAEVTAFLGHAVPSGDPTKRQNLADDARRGSKVTADSIDQALAALETGRSLITSFNYGTHQTYVSITREG